uniref:TSUP family transporter n=1 Tax=Streptomyces sp. DG1A-41 TaxID=3125779 RepID=UPI0040402508
MPHPEVTPTNLLYNVVAGPVALWRYRPDGDLRGDLARRLVPGAARRRPRRHRPVSALPGPDVFRLLAAALLPLGLWLFLRALAPARRRPSPAGELAPRTLTGLALAVGVVGASTASAAALGPILVGRRLPVARVAPAALAATFTTSLVGATAYALLSLTSSADVAPDWWLGLGCGVGGLIGGCLGARLQPRLPGRALRLLLGTLATAVGALYAAQTLNRARHRGVRDHWMMHEGEEHGRFPAMARRVGPDAQQPPPRIFQCWSGPT